MKVELLIIVITILGYYTAIGKQSSTSKNGFNEWKALKYSHSSTPKETQEESVRQMLRRLLKDDSDNFLVEVDPKLGIISRDAFKIASPKSNNDSRVWIVGTTGVAASFGVLHYLKYYCNSHVSWEANQINIPSPLPECHVKLQMQETLRYYQNVCTLSYSFAWWDWPRWERHIDWMALNGINFPLAFVGQEAIWKKVYIKFNFTQNDLDDHFTGPAFLAWGRMGNIQKWGGPLSDSWHNQTLLLQRLILNRMRSFGMIPILPAFAGHVPPAITRVFPRAKVTQLSQWVNFKGAYTRTFLLDARDPLFNQIGVEFIKQMMIEYNGTDHYYNCDPLNEMTPPSSSKSYLRGVSKAIFKTMLGADPDATWVLQGWMFYDAFWTKSAAKAFLTAVPLGEMIVLDLDAGLRPLYNKFESFFGQPFIFCMLNNYGGVDGLFGDFDLLIQNLEKLRSDPTALRIGIGLTPEGILQNYISYDLMLEFGWRNQSADWDEWLTKYASRRYGVDFIEFKEAWKLLKESSYECNIGFCYSGDGTLIQRSPDLRRLPDIWYNTTLVFEAWKLLYSPLENINITIKDAKINSNSIDENNEFSFENETQVDKKFYEQETYLHDLVDVTRQVLQILGNEMIMTLRKCYRNERVSELVSVGKMLLELFDHMDQLLGTSKDFLLGTWVEDAQNWATNEQERQQYLANSLYQITLWGPNGEIKDYAAKQWNGLVRDYMKPRYSFFIELLTNCLLNRTHFNQDKFNDFIFRKVEKPFADQVNVTYSATPTGSSIEAVRDIYKIYRDFISAKTSPIDKICDTDLEELDEDY